MDSFKQLRHPALMHTTSTEMHYTVYSICLLVHCTSKRLPLHGERLKEIQEPFSNGGFLFIDEKSMAGQKHIQLGQKTPPGDTPKLQGQVIWEYLLGDVKQLPPICDYMLFNANAVDPSGYNIYHMFDNAIIFTELVRQQ